MNESGNAGVAEKSINMESKSEYYSQDIKKMWSSQKYDNYANAKWNWSSFPFDDAPEKRRYSLTKEITRPVQNKSILEVGAAMGQAYRFLKESSLVDVSQYTGVEISNKGHQYCKEKYPEANWVQADFSKYELPGNFDYVFERHAVHHMPEPIEQFKKLFSHVNISMNTIFRACLEPGTVSDLNVARFQLAGGGKFFLNLISVPDLLKEGLKAGFNHIRICYQGLHGPIPSDPSVAEWYLDKEVAKQKTIAYVSMRLSRCPSLKKPLVYSVASGRLFGLKLRLTQAEPFARMKSEVQKVLGQF